MAPAAAESASPIGIANLPNQRHKIVAKRGAAFTIMVRFLHGHYACYIASLMTNALLGCWRIRTWKDNIHQHAFLHNDQELCRSQAPASEAG
jgi:septin family protein